MEIVAPLSVHAETPAGARRDDSRIVQVALRNQHQAPPGGRAETFCFHGQLLEKMNGGSIDKGMNGVEPQAVNVEVAHPHQRVVAKKAAHLA